MNLIKREMPLARRNKAKRTNYVSRCIFEHCDSAPRITLLPSLFNYFKVRFTNWFPKRNKISCSARLNKNCKCFAAGTIEVEFALRRNDSRLFPATTESLLTEAMPRQGGAQDPPHPVPIASVQAKLVPQRQNICTMTPRNFLKPR